jgi:hypothetical protein
MPIDEAKAVTEATTAIAKTVLRIMFRTFVGIPILSS